MERTSGFAKDFQQVDLILEKICHIWRDIHFIKCGKICFQRTYWSTLFFKVTFIAIEIKTIHILWYQLKKCGHFLECFCLLAIIVYQKNITTGQRSLILKFQQCIIQSVEPGITKSRYLHFADNQRLTEGNKMSTISPLYNMLNFNLVQFGIFLEVLSVDESMVPYFRRHSA